MSRKISVKCAIAGCHRRLKMTPKQREELRRVGRERNAVAGIVCPKCARATFDLSLVLSQAEPCRATQPRANCKDLWIRSASHYGLTRFLQWPQLSSLAFRHSLIPAF